MIFNLDPVRGLRSQYQPIQNGISNWKAVWNRRISTCADNPTDVSIRPGNENTLLENDEELWRRPGFWKHAAEFWLLSRIFLERLIFSQHGVEATSHFLEQEDSLCGVGSRIRGEYDDTNMRQLHTYIKNFQSLQVS